MTGQTVRSPAQAVTESAQLFNEGKMEASLAYFADDAVYKLIGLPPNLPDIHTGKGELRAWFKEMFADQFQLQVEIVNVEGETVTTKTLSWSNTTRNLGVAPLVASEVYLVKDDQIAHVTWTIEPESQAKFVQAMAARQ